MLSEFLILLVDDEPSVVDILNRVAKYDFPEATFLYASCFEEAEHYLENLEGYGPNLILLDINLQLSRDGLDFLAFVRKHPQGHLIPVVILSSINESSKIREAYQLGVSSYTNKPYDYKAWKTYVRILRQYWFETVTTPSVWFEKQSIHETSHQNAISSKILLGLPIDNVS
ncbi:response regulator [Spirosoma flavum]|uniref:Response regulator n=1 Tax=Spirosoma flavum TaxID=2048557 RepID=A0ABW6AJ68_9BACT